MTETNTPEAAYRAVATGVAWIDRSDRGRLDVLGPDRAKFLHNLTTNDIKRLPIGQGVEAFVTSPQGKTLGFITVHALEDRLLVRADPGGFEHMLPHLRKYGVFDDVVIEDVSKETSEFHVCGSRSTSFDDPNVIVTSESFRVFQESPFGVPGCTIIVPASQAANFLHALRIRPEGMIDLDPDTAEVLRIEAGTPVFGRDISIENLPQEVARDDHAINFVKGCYLGQETVARLDALGHVNKIRRGLRINGGESDVPAAGAVISADGKPVGKVTSAAYSEGCGQPAAMGYVKTSLSGIGTEVIVELGDRTVRALVSLWPMRQDS